MKRGFTLIEVTLAMGVMAIGLMSVVGLYAYGFRESGQSREDVGATAVADAVLGQLTMAISATNLKWSVFKDLRSYPSDEGWGFFVDRSSGRIREDPTKRAKDDFASFMRTLAAKKATTDGSLGCDTSFPNAALASTGLKCGLVILHEQDSAIVRIGFRAMKQRNLLLASPMFYTEVRFQGVDE